MRALPASFFAFVPFDFPMLHICEKGLMREFGVVPVWAVEIILLQNLPKIVAVIEELISSQPGQAKHTQKKTGKAMWA